MNVVAETKPTYTDETISIIHANMRDILPQLSDIDAVITDPPYELGFMGKDWDNKGISFKPEIWRLILDACKPGAHLLAFGGTRTFHRIAVAIEDAGWEIRDTVMWVYGQGFPKSLDVSKAIDKHGGKAVGWFGKWLREWRIRKDITQKEIVNRRGRMRTPSLNHDSASIVAFSGHGLHRPNITQSG